MSFFFSVPAIGNIRCEPILQTGFTLFELMISLAISAIILTAVASLTYAVSYAIKDTEEISHKQARIRMATLKIKELVKN